MSPSSSRTQQSEVLMPENRTVSGTWRLSTRYTDAGESARSDRRHDVGLAHEQQLPAPRSPTLPADFLVAGDHLSFLLRRHLLERLTDEMQDKSVVTLGATVASGLRTVTEIVVLEIPPIENRVEQPDFPEQTPPDHHAETGTMVELCEAPVLFSRQLPGIGIDIRYPPVFTPLVAPWIDDALCLARAASVPRIGAASRLPQITSLLRRQTYSAFAWR